MQPLSLIKHLKIYLQATVFFCATSVVQIYFLNTDFIWWLIILLLVLLVFILLFN